jgi:peptidoglycan hydrolase-like protein with peptidoglycan-binding domain
MEGRVTRTSGSGLLAAVLLLGPLLGGAGAASSTDATGTALDLASLKKLEQHLSEAGFDPGPVDGKVDARTQQAVREFQRAKGLDATGLLDAGTQAALLAEAPGVRQGVSGPGPRPAPGEFRGPGAQRNGTSRESTPRR